MRVAVVGAGVIGTLTAYYLRAKGCDVTVYDGAAHAAALTSNANGGQLSYSFCDALADPQLLSKMPGILAGRDPAFAIRGFLDPHFVHWGLRFLRECTDTRRDRNTLALLSLCARSAELMQPLLKRFGAVSNYAQSGKLVLLDEAPTPELKRRVQLKVDQGIAIEFLDGDQILEREPTIRGWSWRPRAAIYSAGDEVADTCLFTQALADCLEGQGVNLQFNTRVTGVEPLAQGSCRILSESHEIEYDACVLATGHSVNELLAPIGVKLPVVPMAGYSLTMAPTEGSPRHSLTVLNKRIVFSPLGQKVRIAGFADFGGHANRAPARVATLKAVAQALAPSAVDYEGSGLTPWFGERAMTPNSQPLVQQISGTRVFTNVGHGMLGWTLAAATGEQVAELVTDCS